VERALTLRRSRALTLVAALVAAVALPATAAEPALTVPRLTLDSALRAAQAALASCRAAGVQAAVAVVDRDGLPQVMLRDTLAPELAARVAQAKAYTSASFDAPSGALESPERPQGRAAPSPPPEGVEPSWGGPAIARERAALAHMPGLLFSGGGLPIDAAGQRYGAIGVSGSPSADLDQRCARAGIDAIVPELEMR
jgi:uncharacterized protein GlcG (DUF336 family)